MTKRLILFLGVLIYVTYCQPLSLAMAQEQRLTIGAIKVAGNRTIETSTIHNSIKCQTGDIFDPKL